MRTELRKYFAFGFVLTEAELRRIVGIAEEQIKKIPGQHTITLRFELRFKDGAVVELSAIDEVLNQENLGSSQIVRLKIESFTEGDPPGNYVSIRFSNLHFEGAIDDEPIAFEVRGESRDWTLVTSSLLEERIKRMRRAAFGRKPRSHLYLYTNAAAIGVLLCVIMVTIYERYPPLTTTPEPSWTVLISSEMEKEIRNKNIKDPVEVIILRDKLLEEHQLRRDAELRKYYRQREVDSINHDIKRIKLLFLLPVFGLLPPLFLYGIRRFFVNYYPAYNFCWGDYAMVFQRKEAVRKFFIIVIVVGVLVSFIGGVLANLIRVRN